MAAFEAFFSAMPAIGDPGMAFVLVQHLAPDHKSILSELIRRYTRMQVFDVEDGMKVRPNCAYIIPPNRDMAFLNGSLQLLEPAAPRGQRLPIDFFFRSLAQDQHERAIGIVLSGTGSDGSLGVRAIKGEGGMVMAQNPESTEYDGMPRSAVATGLVDYVLPPAEMPAQLIAYAGHAFGKAQRLAASPAPQTDDLAKKIFILLRAQTGHDFSEYKPNTINRRIGRRMAIHQIERLEGYLRYLQKDTGEVDALFRDLLIGVTSFFRDPEAFKALQKQVIPSLFAGGPSRGAIRVWVPGCSTGEEAYSIAILLQEHMETLKQSFHVQVFATDIDSRAIEAARAGVYPSSIAADVSPERLARFFAQESEGNPYRINKGIRDMMIFSEQDVVCDPPFSKLDLISCRNLLIYMNAGLQRKLIPLFHYALNRGGRLFLGTSETVGEFSSLFAALDRKAKLYQRKTDVHMASRSIAGRFALSLPEGVGASTEARRRALDGRKTGDSMVPMRELMERALLRQYVPTGALVNARGDILYLHGRASKYLELPPGEADTNILRMAREGLRRDLTTALHRAVAHMEPVRLVGLRVKTNGDFTTINLAIRPVPPEPAVFGTLQGDAVPALFLVIFEELSAVPAGRDAGRCRRKGGSTLSKGAAARRKADGSSVDDGIAALKQELLAKDEYLQAANEELETSNEELKASNEEMQSVNEELQSTNEELETSKEELQSVNEELATVNAELQTKVADLSRANNDMNNLMAGTGIGTIFVDHQLRIQRFTPAVTQIINLIPTDVGRPVGHIVSNLTGYDRLVADLKDVLNDLTPKEVEVQTQAGAWFLMRIRPYRTQENVIEGAVITFVEITRQKELALAIEETREYAETMADTIREPLLILDKELNVISVNRAFTEFFKVSAEMTIGRRVYDLGNGQWNIPKLRTLLEEILPRNEVLEKYEVTHEFPGIGRRSMVLNARSTLQKAGKERLILLAMEDTTK